MDTQQYKSKNQSNECWIIRNKKSQQRVTNNTKVKTTAMNTQQYKSKNHNNDCSIIQN